MKYDSFITPHHTHVHNAFTRWWQYSLLLSLVITLTIIAIHAYTASTYAQQIARCSNCEQNTLKIQPNLNERTAVSQEYATLSEQINSMQEHLANKARLALLANDFLTNTRAPVAIQSLALTARECSLIFRCPQTYAVHTLADHLNKKHPQMSFRVARLEQRDDALLVTVQTTWAAQSTPTKS